jgi:hypothetical protein
MLAIFRKSNSPIVCRPQQSQVHHLVCRNAPGRHHLWAAEKIVLKERITEALASLKLVVGLHFLRDHRNAPLVAQRHDTLLLSKNPW